MRAEANRLEIRRQFHLGEPGGVSPRILAAGESLRGLTPPGSLRQFSPIGPLRELLVSSITLGAFANWWPPVCPLSPLAM